MTGGKLCCTWPGLPFILLNTLCGAYCAYGLASLRYTAAAVLLWGVLMALNALIAIQLMVFCVYLTPNQARADLGNLHAGTACLVHC